MYICDSTVCQCPILVRRFQKNLMVMQLLGAESRYLEIINFPCLCIVMPPTL